MAFVGYLIDLGDEGHPIAAAETYEDAFRKTFQRVVAIYSGDIIGLGSSQLSVQQRDLSPDQIARFEQIVEKALNHTL